MPILSLWSGLKHVHKEASTWSVLDSSGKSLSSPPLPPSLSSSTAPLEQFLSQFQGISRRRQGAEQELWQVPCYKASVNIAFLLIDMSVVWVGVGRNFPALCEKSGVKSAISQSLSLEAQQDRVRKAHRQLPSILIYDSLASMTVFLTLWPLH